MKENMPVSDNAHFVKIDARAHAVISGVEDVELFSSGKIFALTNQGAITITGEGMQVETLNISDGQLIINGRIDAVSYDERTPKTKSVLSRLFR